MTALPTPATLWQIIPLTRVARKNLLSHYAAAIDELIQDGFGDGIVAMPLAHLRAALADSNFVGLLVIEGKLVAFMLAYVPVAKYQGKSFIWVNKLVVAANYQGRHYGSPRTLVEAFRLSFPTLEIGFIGARTQSPGLLRSFINLSPSNYPFARRYHESNEETGVQLLLFCFLCIPQLRNAYNPASPFVVSVGLFIGAYQNKLGVGRAENGNPEAENLLRKLNFQRERGDAILIVAPV